jgi:septum site-determining protein MinD
VIIDCAPGFGRDVQNAIKACDELIVVTTPNIPDVEDAMKIIELVKMMKKSVKGFVLNRYADERYELTPEQVQETLGVPMLGIVPEDKKVPESIAAGVPLITYAKYSKASKAIKKIAAAVTGDEYRPDGLFARLKHFLVGERYDFERKPEEFVEQINGD